MALSDAEEQAIRELAEIEGRSVEDVKREMLRAKLGLSGAPAQDRTPTALARRPGSGDASGADLARVRQEAVQRHQSQEFPGSPVVRYRGDHRDESPEEAQERWYEEEAELLDGVHGLGGSTAGGIFGGGPIATNIYDPEAMGRADGRIAQTASIKMLGLVERLEARLTASEAARELPAPQRGGALPGAATRRLGRGKR
jgi:hypothetical protein